MNKQEYLLKLLDRLKYMIEENKKLKARGDYLHHQNVKPNTVRDYKAYYNETIYSKSAIRSVRREIQRVMLEMEKEND